MGMMDAYAWGVIIFLLLCVAVVAAGSFGLYMLFK